MSDNMSDKKKDKKKKNEDKKNENHYVDNKEFFVAMSEWKKYVIEADNSGEPRPPITEYVIDQIL